MSNQQISNIHQDIIIQLEIVSEDEQQPDIADVEEISREIVDYLRSNGYSVEPTYTGTKGNPGFEIIMHAFHVIHDHEALVAAVFSFASSAVQGIMKVSEWRLEKDKTRSTPFEVVLEVDGKPLIIKTLDAKNTAKLIEQFQNTHSEATKQVPSRSNLKIKVHVPKKEQRRKR